MGSLFNPPAANVPTPQISNYQPTGMAGAESGALSGIGGLGQYNVYGQVLPQAQAIGQGLVSSPYAGAFQQGAGTAGALGQNAALGAYGQGGNLYGMAGGLQGLAGQVANTAFDPLNALYNQVLQQTQDQARAANAAAGVATTPYGAGLENQALNNLNINWQNNLLNRQVQGAQAAGGLTGQAGSLIGQGAGLQAGAPGQYLTAAGMPYATAQGIGSGQLGTLGQLGQFGTQAAQLPQQQIADYMNYLGWGTGAQNAANQAQLGLGQFGLNQANQGFQQQQAMLGGLGQIAGGLWGTNLPGGAGTVGGNILSGLGSFL